MTQRIGRILVLAAAAFAMAGCTATVTMAPPEEDAAAKRFEPLAGQANVYIARKDQFTGSAIAFELAMDGRIIGSVAPGTYLLLEVSPGAHAISSSTAENQDIVKFKAVAGQNHFFELKPKMGWVAARVDIIEIDETAGKELVKAGSLAQDMMVAP